MLKRRKLLARRFISGDWGVELKDFEAGRTADERATMLASIGGGG